jgi:signal transduction histidine kinase
LLRIDSDSTVEPILNALHAAGHTVAAQPTGTPLAAGEWDVVLAPPEAAETPRLEAKLAEQREEMRALSARLNELEEAARRRLSAELHDRVGQSLTALGLHLNLVRGGLDPAGATALANRVDAALQLVDDVTAHVRDVMVELRPPVLDDYGLLAALRWHGERLAENSGLRVEVAGEEIVPRLPLIVETALFRITQEALTNIVRHAGAQKVSLSWATVPGGEAARLVIADDGQGFSPQRPRPLGERPRWGLITMRERAETVGGTMRIESAPGTGTRIIIEVAR